MLSSIVHAHPAPSTAARWVALSKRIIDMPPPFGIREDAQGPPLFRGTPLRSYTMSFTPEATGNLPALASGPGNPRMRVLQDPTQAIQTLARLSPDSV